MIAQAAVSRHPGLLGAFLRTTVSLEESSQRADDNAGRKKCCACAAAGTIARW